MPCLRRSWACFCSHVATAATVLRLLFPLHTLRDKRTFVRNLLRVLLPLLLVGLLPSTSVTAESLPLGSSPRLHSLGWSRPYSVPPTTAPPTTALPTTTSTLPSFPSSYCVDTPPEEMTPTDGNLCLIQHDVEQLRVSTTFGLWLLVAVSIATLLLSTLRKRT